MLHLLRRGYRQLRPAALIGLPGLFAMILLLVFGPAPAGWAQEPSAPGNAAPVNAPMSATPRHVQTLEEILARQKSAGDDLLRLRLTPPEAPPGALPEGAAPPVTGPLGPRGDLSLSGFWDRLRGGDPLAVAAPRPPGAAMNTSGQLWRLLREQYLRRYLGWVPLAVLGLLALFFLLRGRIRIPGGRSGRTVPRFSLGARVAHWFMASVFLFLALSGLVILLGREIIAPYLGKEVNAILSTAAMQGHNLFGPIFIFALGWMLVKFLRGNFFRLVDLKWLIRLGGFFGGHARAGRYNLGEKFWFWSVILVGLIMSASGILMLFPWLVEDLRWLQLATVLHVLGAIYLISFALGHIYLGTIGTEGTLEGMIRGEVDENWAKAHHDLWLEEVAGHGASEREAAE